MTQGGLFGGLGTLIKSIQNGVITDTGGGSTATINAVDTANSIVLHNGFSTAISNTDFQVAWARLALTNATTVTSTHYSFGAATCSVAFTVIEFYPGVIKSVQRGTFAMNAVTSATQAITSVDTTKAVLIPIGYTFTSGSSDSTDKLCIKIVLTNATTVTATSAAANTGGFVIGYQVVEFY